MMEVGVGTTDGYVVNYWENGPMEGKLPIKKRNLGSKRKVAQINWSSAR